MGKSLFTGGVRTVWSVWRTFIVPVGTIPSQSGTFSDRVGTLPACARSFSRGGETFTEAVETAPVENPILGTNDSAMLAVLEASLPTMNEEMINSMARARNAPAPAAANPDSKRFWRILVNPDIDTDMDGSPDWAEFEIAAAQASAPSGNQPGNDPEDEEDGSAASGNAYDADTNNDGIPDTIKTKSRPCERRCW